MLCCRDFGFFLKKLGELHYGGSKLCTSEHTLNTPPDERQSSVFYKVQIQTGKNQFPYQSTTQSDHNMHNCKVKIY